MVEFPSRVLFKPIAACGKLQAPPEIDGDLDDWKGIEPLAAFGELDDEDVFADIFAAWHAEGLFIAERRPNKTGAVTVNRRLPHSGDGLQVWMNTRPGGEGHRATRYCHHFVLLPKGGGDRRSQPMAWQERISRARGRPQTCDPTEIDIAAKIAGDHYTIEAHLPADILNGYDPQAGNYVGFNYLVHDVHADRQYWTVPKDFDADQDPSLWGLLELTD